MQLETSHGAVWHRVSFEYDANGNETMVRVQDGASVDDQAWFVYDSSDRLTEVVHGGVPQLMRLATHRPFGPIEQYRLGSELPWASVQKVFDQRDRLQLLTLTQPGQGAVLERSYEYLDGLNVTAWADGGRATSFEYDDLSRLVGAAEAGGATWSYTYDLMGNRLSETVTGAGAAAWAYQYVPNAASGNSPLLQQMVEAGGGQTMPVVHDDDGNVTGLLRQTDKATEPVVDLGYTGDMVLASHAEEGVETLFRYDADGYLVQAMRSDESPYQDARFVYDHRGRLLAILHPEPWPDANRFYVYGEGQPIGMVLGAPGSQVTYHAVADHMGTPILYYRDAGHLARPWYSPFGKLMEVDQVGGVSPPLDHRFPGQVDLTSSVSSWPISYNVHRWYLPDWGRYTQADPIGLDGGVSLFDYSSSNPVNLSDPTGLFTNTLRCFYWKAKCANRGTECAQIWRCEIGLMEIEDMVRFFERASGAAGRPISSQGQFLFWFCFETLNECRNAVRYCGTAAVKPPFSGKPN